MLSFDIFMVHHVLGGVLGGEVENEKSWEALISEVRELITQSWRLALGV